MSDLKSLKIRINSIAKTKKITQAMKMVAASKLRKAREAAENNRFYKARLNIMIDQAIGAADLANERSLISNCGKVDSVLYLIVTTDRGLCGSLNTNIVKHIKQQIAQQQAKGKKAQVLIIGAKGNQQLVAEFSDNIVEYREGFSSRPVEFAELDHLAEKLAAMYNKQQFDQCNLVFAKFLTAMSQEIVDEQLIPFAMTAQQPPEGPVADYEYEPNAKECLNRLLPANICAKIYNAALETFASEQGSRMTAMDNAVKNCEDLTKSLRLVYNRTRQAKITTELVEIISAVESM